MDSCRFRFKVFGPAEGSIESVPGKRNPAVLVVGADGAIGKAVSRAFRSAGARVIETTRRAPTSSDRVALDLSGSIAAVSLPTVDVAFLLAAVTDLAACERDPEGTSRINEHHTVELARRLADQGAHVVFPSTNIVFDGSIPARKAEDPVCPPAEYGRQKARVEGALSELGRSAAVLRLTKVVGPATEPFASWVRKLRQGETIEAFEDKVCAPVTLDETAALLLGIGKERLSGVFQASAARDMSYARAAEVLARRVGAHVRQVRVVRGQDRGVPEILRPRHTTLDGSRLAEALGWSPPEPENALCEGLGL